MGLNTHQDPIGIAGGLNLYGYANGDPVNYSDPFGLDPCEGIVDLDHIEEASLDEFEEFGRCKLEQYSQEYEAEGREATRLANGAELGECVAAAVLTGEAMFADALVVAAGASVLKALHAATTGPVWAAGVAWRAASIVGSTGDRVALATGRGAESGSQHYAGGERPPGLISHLLASPRAWERSNVACSR